MQGEQRAYILRVKDIFESLDQQEIKSLFKELLKPLSAEHYLVRYVSPETVTINYSKTKI